MIYVLTLNVFRNPGHFERIKEAKKQRDEKSMTYWQKVEAEADSGTATFSFNFGVS